MWSLVALKYERSRGKARPELPMHGPSSFRGFVFSRSPTLREAPNDTTAFCTNNNAGPDLRARVLLRVLVELVEADQDLSWFAAVGGAQDPGEVELVDDAGGPAIPDPQPALQE